MSGYSRKITNDKLAKLVTIVFPLLVLFIYLSREFLIEIGHHFPDCYFYKKTGYMCSACGNTRSVICLLNGEILESLHYNITPIILIVITFFFYVECICQCLGHTIYILPRKKRYLYSLLIYMITYYFVRNLS